MQVYRDSLFRAAVALRLAPPLPSSNLVSLVSEHAIPLPAVRAAVVATNKLGETRWKREGVMNRPLGVYLADVFSTTSSTARTVFRSAQICC